MTKVITYHFTVFSIWWNKQKHFTCVKRDTFCIYILTAASQTAKLNVRKEENKWESETLNINNVSSIRNSISHVVKPNEWIRGQIYLCYVVCKRNRHQKLNSNKKKQQQLTKGLRVTCSDQCWWDLKVLVVRSNRLQ